MRKSDSRLKSNSEPDIITSLRLKSLVVQAVNKALKKMSSSISDRQLFSISDIQKPPSFEMGNLALSCFKQASIFKMSPVELSRKLAESVVLPAFFEKVVSFGPYLNFYFNFFNLLNSLLPSLTKQDSEFFSSDLFFLFGSNFDKATESSVEKSNSKKKRYVIEFSSPNTNKPQHLGHVRNNLLGMSLSRLLSKQGIEIIKANLLNDRGLGVSKVIYAYLYLSKRKEPKGKPDHFVGELYTLFNKEARKNPNLNKEAQKILRLWEDGNPEVVNAWKKLVGYVITGYDETYQKLGCSFDIVYRESDIYCEGRKIVLKALKASKTKKYFKEENGAVIAKLEEFNLPDKVLIKSNGTALYVTQDIALAKKKFESYNPDLSIYVVGSEQELYFKQLFKIIELLGIANANRMYHLKYGLILLEGGKMKSREGLIVDADDLIENLEKLAYSEVCLRYPDISDDERRNRAEKIAMAALKFYILKYDPVKDILFKPKESISFEGETGPYLLYTFARIKSILRKSGLDIKKYRIHSEKLNLKEEHQIVSFILDFHEIVYLSALNFKPSILARYLVDFAQFLNSYYHSTKVLGHDTDLVVARLALLSGAANTIKAGLELLCIDVLEEM